MICVMAWILTHVFTAWLGMTIAERSGQPWALGATVGLVFHLPGILVLWAVLYLAPRAEGGSE